MKVYLLNKNTGRNVIINEDNKWYYFPYAIDGCDIDCVDVYEAIENLEKHIKTIYSNNNAIDISNFKHMTAYDGLVAGSFMDIIYRNEIRQGVAQRDLSRVHFICDTDAIKGGEN